MVVRQLGPCLAAVELAAIAAAAELLRARAASSVRELVRGMDQVRQRVCLWAARLQWVRHPPWLLATASAAGSSSTAASAAFTARTTLSSTAAAAAALPAASGATHAAVDATANAALAPFLAARHASATRALAATRTSRARAGEHTAASPTPAPTAAFADRLRRRFRAARILDRIKR